MVHRTRDDDRLGPAPARLRSRAPHADLPARTNGPQRLNETTRGELPVLTATELTEHPSPPDRDTQIDLLCRRQVMRA